MGKFVNIHAHASSSAHIELINHCIQDSWEPESNKLYSVGFHPWHIADFVIHEMIKKMNVLAHRSNVLAIGECGLDRAVKIQFKKQEEVFLKQIEIAEAVKKPLIIHSVRSYPDLINIKKTRNTDIPWILHGYNGNKQTTEQLLKHNFYFSFGAILLRNRVKLIDSLHMIPLNKVFFETDESPEQIETIYIFAAQQLSLSLDELKAGIAANFKTIFSNG